MIPCAVVKFAGASGGQDFLSDEDRILIALGSVGTAAVVGGDPTILYTKFSNPGLGDQGIVDDSVFGSVSAGGFTQLPPIPLKAQQRIYITSAGIGSVFLYFLT